VNGRQEIIKHGYLADDSNQFKTVPSSCELFCLTGASYLTDLYSICCVAVVATVNWQQILINK
jgi:hypothetical protein